MSWSISASGTADEVKQAMDAEEQRLLGESKSELSETKLAIQAILSTVDLPKVTLSANGHARFNSDGKNYSYFSIIIEGFKSS